MNVLLNSDILRNYIFLVQILKKIDRCLLYPRLFVFGCPSFEVTDRSKQAINLRISILLFTVGSWFEHTARGPTPPVALSSSAAHLPT